MKDLRDSNIYKGNSDSLLTDNPKTQKRCGLGIMKCLGCIIFLSGTSALSFYLGVKYGNYLEENDGSL